MNIQAVSVMIVTATLRGHCEWLEFNGKPVVFPLVYFLPTLVSG